MIKIGKILIWLFFIAFFIGGLALSGVVFYLETSIDKVMSKEKQEQFFGRAENSPVLPHSFYRVVEKYYPGYFEQGVWGSIWDQVLGKRRNGCQCRDLYSSRIY